MATIALQIAGSAFGSFLGGPIGGAIGSAVGGTLGSLVDRALLGGGKRTVHGPRLSDLNGISASEGAPIARVYGRVRVGGQIIWATEFEEEQTIEKTGSSGGKSLGGGQTTRTVRYRYYANVAIGLCEGPIHLVRRIWADGEELDLGALTHRVHLGAEDQAPDPLIVAKQESADIPAFRGLAYVVFERLPLEAYGNRLPQFTFEVVRAAPGLPEMIRAINIIPGSTEFGYSATEIRALFGPGSSQPVNRTQWTHATDWEASIDALQALAPNLERATLVCAWFGDDLRAAHCTFRPKVEKAEKTTSGQAWQAAGITREVAQAVSEDDGRPNFGGSPSDQSVIDAIRDLKTRGLKVALHPFVLMDIAPGNALPDPWSGAGAQPAFPWRGRITCDPAPGRPGSPDGTTALAAQMTPLIGAAAPAHFSRIGDTIVYAGPDEWSFRRMILHHAMLAQAAGGVDAFLIASELVGLTHAYAGAGSFPFSSALAALAADVRTILGPATTITYAADWTEYGAHVRDGGQEVRFPLDVVWSHPEIGAIGIDFYPPLSDWRAGLDHADAALAAGAADPDYLRMRIASGEAFDWYYADDDARRDQARTPITDGAYAKPWMFRQKDIRDWWRNPHHERAGGVELALPTAYAPQGKPIYLVEIGCPAVDKGANQPNVFPDPKSVENALPHFSHGGRDDLVQRRLLEAYLGRFDPQMPGFEPADNPVSSVYGGPMVAPDFIAPWAWDARPFPVFPRQTDLWSDGGNWLRGHWLNGRIEATPVDALFGMILADFGLPPADATIDGIIDGYVIERPMSARAAIEPLATLFGLTARLAAGGIAFIGRPRAEPVPLGADDLVPMKDGTLIEITRRQESELPRRANLAFVDSEADFRQAVVLAEKTDVDSRREQNEQVAAHMPRGYARRLIETRLQDIWTARETFSFALKSSRMALEPGDLVMLDTTGGPRLAQLTRVADDSHRRCEARAFDPSLAVDVPVADEPILDPRIPALPGAAHARLLELPIDRSGGLLAVAVRASPWRGPYSVTRIDAGAPAPAASIGLSARIGTTLTPLGPGPLWRWDHAATLDVVLEEGALSSLGDEAVLAGGNALALVAAGGEIEIVLFGSAALVGERRYRLSRLLRGIGGSEAAAARILAPGAEAVILDDAIVDIGVGADSIGAVRSFAVLPAGRGLGDPTEVDVGATPSGIALLPLAPVHAKASRNAGGIGISFIRRARRDGDGLDLYEVPLGEGREEYRFEIMNGAVPVRSVTLTAPEYLYPNAEELADFGTAQTTLSIRVRQMSMIVGPGRMLEAIVPIHA